MLIVLLGVWQGAVGRDAAAPLIRLARAWFQGGGGRKETGKTGRGKLNGGRGFMSHDKSYIRSKSSKRSGREPSTSGRKGLSF